MNLFRRITLRNGIIAGAFVALGAVAAAGWTRKTPTSAPTSANVPYAYDSGSGTYSQPTAQPPANNPPDPATNPPNIEQRDTYGRPIVSTAYTSNPCADPNNPGYQSTVYAPVGQDQYYAAHYIHGVNRPVVVRSETVERDYVAPDNDRRVYVEGSSDRMVYQTHRPRSTKKSIAIIAGSSAVGAGVGALAGGGKGAGIGALVGGAGGFIYDRLTHKR